MNNSTRKFDNLDEVHQFLEKHKLPQLTYHERYNLNSPINIKEIEFIISNLHQKSLQVHMVSLENSTKFLIKN